MQFGIIMMRKVRQTQVDSYLELTDDLSNRQSVIFDAIKALGKGTNRQIAQHLGWDINRVTGRVTELVNLGKVIPTGTYFDVETNRTVTLWKLAK